MRIRHGSGRSRRERLSPVFIYPGLSAQTALLMAREPAWCENHLRPILSDYFETMSVAPYIGDNARVERCGLLMNVAVGRGVTVGRSRIAPQWNDYK